MFTSKFYDNIFSSNILRFTLSNLEIEHSLKKKEKVQSYDHENKKWGAKSKYDEKLIY